MMDHSRHSSDRSELVRIIHRVRRRWRLKIALRGAAGMLAGGVLVLLLAAVSLESLRFSAPAIVTFRVLTFVSLIGLTVYLLVRPLMRQVNDEQVALYLEEREPSLEATILSAIEASRTGSSHESPALVRRLVESAIEKCQSIERGHRVEQQALRRYTGALGATAVVACALFILGPSYLRHATSALLLVSRSLEAAAPYRIDVLPGNATVPRGADQAITARLHGFDAEHAELLVRRSPTTPFERLPLVPGESNHYDGMLFDLAGPVDYFVEAAGVRSSVFRLNVVELPYVRRLELEYRFPAYTGLSPRKIEDGGDIVVLRGTEVEVRVVSTIPARGGRLILRDKPLLLTANPDGTLFASFVADRDGFYRVELDAVNGERVPASPQYTIDVLSDQPPSVSFSKPGRDTMASPIEEVFVEARAEDDFGVRQLELVYSANGGPEKAIRLFDGRRRLAEITAGHTFYLEELGLQAGDFVSYYARAADNDAVQGPKQAMSDMYFLRIRPFQKAFRPAVSQAGMAGGAGGEVGALSEQQRQIISATFNVQRDRKSFTAEKLRESMVVITLAQARLREQVEVLLTRMNSRLVEPDPAFKKIGEVLPQAVAEMKAAEGKLQALSPGGALPPEQRALQHLQQAEEEYELQVSVSRNAGGGAGGGAGSMAEDLADLFKLELDRLANQYETTQRETRQNADQKLDELMEKLKELARRQEQEAARRRLQAAAGQSSGAGGNQQRALADQADEAARRLEQLSRDENRADLMDSARRLREAADAMRRAAANGDPNAAGQASAALERLREAQHRLAGAQSARAGRDVGDALRQAEEIAREQGEIAEDVRGLEGGGAARNTKVQQLSERKDALEAKVAALEKQLDRTAGDIRRDERDASRKLQEAAGSIRDNKIREKIRYSKGIIRSPASPELARNFEEEIGANLDALKRTLGEAAAAVGRSTPDAMTRALDKARQLGRGLESLDQRMRERAGQQADSQRGDARRRAEALKDNQGGRSVQGNDPGRGEAGNDNGRYQGGRNDGGRNAGRATIGGQRGDGDTLGAWRDGGGFGDRRPGRFTGEDIRQFRGEIRQWSAEAQALRRLLREQDIDAKDLEEILRALRALDDERVYHDAAELERLQTFVTEGVKRFEFGLRRRAEADSNQVFLSGSDEVPEQFRKLVEQYYRSLSKAPR